MTSPSSNNNGDMHGSVLTLTHAMKTADCIRRNLNKGNDNGTSHKQSLSAFLNTPGLIPGIGGFVVAGSALFPIRRLILQRFHDHKAFQGFVDLTISVGHALVATQFGLMAGSLFGCNFYLNEMNQIPPTSDSPVARQICDELWKSSNAILPSQALLEAPLYTDNQPQQQESWNPNVKTIQALNDVIQNCRKRRDFESSGSHMN